MGNMDFLFAVGFLALGVAFKLGYCKNWLLGNDPETRKKYKEKETLNYFSLLMFVLSAVNWISVVGAAIGRPELIYLSVILNAIVIVIGLGYFLKSKRFRN